jgi:hypothetical protein
VLLQSSFVESSAVVTPLSGNVNRLETKVDLVGDVMPLPSPVAPYLALIDKRMIRLTSSVQDGTGSW